MKIEQELAYTASHEWVRREGGKAYVGITDHAQESLGDIVYVELPELDTDLKKGEEVTTIESVKAATAIYTPLSGKIIEVNDDLEATPEMINEKPYEAYIFVVEIADESELNDLLNAAAYEKLVAEEE